MSTQRRDICCCSIHPIPITRFRFVRTQALESFSAAVELPTTKKIPGNPILEKVIVRENIVMGTGCSHFHIKNCQTKNL